jgi:hypothetical protein
VLTHPNIEAIRIAFTLDREKRRATDAEREGLVTEGDFYHKYPVFM